MQFVYEMKYFQTISILKEWMEQLYSLNKDGIQAELNNLCYKI